MAFTFEGYCDHTMNPKPLHFLLVDDDEDDRNIFSEVMLELSDGADVQTLNGYKALTQYLAKVDGMLPDLIFLDINMLGKDGFALLEELKADKKFHDVQV